MKDTTVELGNQLKLLPSYKYYDIAIQVLEKLGEFGVIVRKFTSDNTGFTFSYKLTDRICLGYEELEAIRSIVNPARDRKYTVHQMTMFEFTDLFIHPDAK